MATFGSKKLYLVVKKLTYHDPRPFKHGTSNGNSPNFFKFNLVTISLGMSSVKIESMSMEICPGMGISSGLLQPTNCIGAFSYPSKRYMWDEVKNENVLSFFLNRNYHFILENVDLL